MKSRLGYLFVGVLLGFFLHSFWFQERKEAIPAHSPVESSVSVPPREKEQVTEAVVEMQDQQSDILALAQPEEAKPIARPEQKAYRLQFEPSKSLKLMINEETLSEIEHHQDSLREPASSDTQFHSKMNGHSS